MLFMSMDVRKVVEGIQDEATCSVCLEIFTKPVILDCGHNFCNACIIQCWQGSETDVSCPQCRQTFTCVNIRPNRQLGNILGLLKQCRLQDVVVVKMASLCEVHQKPLNLFCKDDQVLLCYECTKLSAHASHIFAPLEPAAETYKDEIQTLLEVKKKQREVVLSYFSEVGGQRQNLVKLMEGGAQKIMLEYMQLCQVMKGLQANLTELAASMRKDLDNKLTEFCEEITSIEKQIAELESKYEQPASEFLQDIKQTISKFGADAFQDPDRGSPELKVKLWDLSLRSLFVQDTLRKCAEALPLQPKAIKANVTLDPTKAHPHLVLSENRKRAKHGGLVAGSQDTDSVACVLGCDGFASGRHYWEVEISARGGQWAVGVAKESFKMKGDVAVGLDDGIWALNSEVHCLPWRRDFSRICVYLDYEGGRVAFFDDSSSDLIATFTAVAFTGERIFPFFMVLKYGAQIKLHN